MITDSFALSAFTVPIISPPVIWIVLFVSPLKPLQLISDSKVPVPTTFTFPVIFPLSKTGLSSALPESTVISPAIGFFVVPTLISTPSVPVFLNRISSIIPDTVTWALLYSTVFTVSVPSSVLSYIIVT